MKSLELIKKSLTDAELAAKALADKEPGNATAQALRARCRAALDLCDSPAWNVLPADQLSKAAQN